MRITNKDLRCCVGLLLIIFFASQTNINASPKHKKKPKATAKQIIVYPAPPDTARIQYLTTINNSTFFGKRSKFATFVQGNETVSTIGKPHGICFTNNILYICDLTICGLEIYDFNTKKYREFVPGGLAKLKNPQSIYVDKNDFKYIADPGRHEVLIFDSVDNLVTCIVDSVTNFKPTDVKIFDDKVWVTNPENHKINIYDKYTYKLERQFPQQYEAGDDGFLYSPYFMNITDDKVYVSDFGDFKIKIYDQKGKFMNSVGSYGTAVGQFVRPKGIATDKEENLYVVDAGFENTQIFNKDAQLLMYFGGSYKGHGDMWLPFYVSISYENIDFFKKYVDSKYNLKYIIIVSNQYGPDKINVYGAISPK